MNRYCVISINSERKVTLLYENIKDIEFAELLVQKELSEIGIENKEIICIICQKRELSKKESKVAEFLADRHKNTFGIKKRINKYE